MVDFLINIWYLLTPKNWNYRKIHINLIRGGVGDLLMKILGPAYKETGNYGLTRKSTIKTMRDVMAR